MQIENWWYRISIKALIYNDEGRFLLCKENTWIWDLPWWGLDHWENIVECIKREIKEELGLDVTYIENNPKYFLTAHKPDNKTRPWIANVCYEVKVKDLNFTPSDECVEIWFFYPEEVKNINAIINVVELSKQMLK
jgi:ADP-ribose pyrophosphatase YjhB (NUDIX family)